MKTLAYPIQQKNAPNTYTFVSSGLHGQITKHVEFRWMNRNLFNISFGDFVGEDYDDLVESNNGDLLRVFATLIAIIDLFFTAKPNATLFLGGSNAQRRRVYSYIVNRNHKALSQKYRLYGQNDTRKWETYKSNKEYAYFLIRKV